MYQARRALRIRMEPAMAWTTGKPPSSAIASRVEPAARKSRVAVSATLSSGAANVPIRALMRDFAQERRPWLVLAASCDTQGRVRVLRDRPQARDGGGGAGRHESRTHISPTPATTGP